MQKRLSDYRIEAGVYNVHGYVIYYGGSRSWQLRCKLDSIIDWFPTLRAAIAYAEQLAERDAARGW